MPVGEIAPTLNAELRPRDPPFSQRSELGDTLAEHGYRIGPEFADGGLFARFSSTPGEVTDRTQFPNASNTHGLPGTRHKGSWHQRADATYPHQKHVTWWT